MAKNETGIGGLLQEVPFGKEVLSFHTYQLCELWFPFACKYATKVVFGGEGENPAVVHRVHMPFLGSYASC